VIDVVLPLTTLAFVTQVSEKCKSTSPSAVQVKSQQKTIGHHHHHVQEVLGLIPVACVLKMKLVPPSLPRSSYVSSSFWFIL